MSANPQLPGTVSVRSLSRHTHKGLDQMSRAAAQKLLLTAHLKANHLSFTRKYASWPSAVSDRSCDVRKATSLWEKKNVHAHVMLIDLGVMKR